MAAKRGRALIIQPSTIDELLQRYKELWSNWETYKILVETSRHPELVLVSGDVDTLEFVDFAQLLRKWHLKLDPDHLPNIDDDKNPRDVEPELVSAEEEVVEETCVDQTDSLLSSRPPGEQVDPTVMSEESTTTAVAENFMKSQREEKRTFVITGVLDGRTKEIISMTDAVKAGIINPANGTYQNLATGDTYPIPVAMNAGFIEVEYTTVTKGEEKRKDIGLLTIHTHKESRPYTVKGILDVKNDVELSVDEAMSRGVFKPASKSCLNTESGEEMSLSDALDCGLLVVEFDKTAEVAEPEVVALTYEIHGVKDVKNGRQIPFSEAVRRRIIDQESGCFVNNDTGEEIFIGDAIKSGFIKARVVRDPKKIDVAAENRMVFSKIQKSKIRAIGRMAASMKNGQS